MNAHLPMRGDAVEVWLRARRDEYSEQHDTQWDVIDQLLDDYRLHADTGVPLDQHVCEGGTVDDCAGCRDAARSNRPGPAALANPDEHGWEWGLRTTSGYVLGPFPTRAAALDRAITGKSLVRRAMARGPWTETETTR